MEFLSDPNAQTLVAMGGGAVAIVAVQGAVRIVQSVVERVSRSSSDHDHAELIKEITTVKTTVNTALPSIKHNLDEIVQTMREQNNRSGKMETELAVQSQRLSVIENEMKRTGSWGTRNGQSNKS